MTRKLNTIIVMLMFTLSYSLDFGSLLNGQKCPLCEPEYKCICTDSKVDCGHLSIRELKPNIEFSDDVIIVNFQGNELRNLQKSFVTGPNVRVLDLSHNNIDFISSVAFTGLKKLTRLNLSHNRIWNLAVDTFSGLPLLQKLDLSYNNLQNFFPNIFESTPMIIILSLEFNPIMYLDSEAFKYLPKLEHLNLRYTGISSLPDKLFESNKRLKYLSLANNALTSIPSKTFKSLGSLLHLDLNDNPIASIKSGEFNGLANLTNLYISKMKELKNIEKFAFEGLINLRYLQCSHNYRLAEIDAMAFATNNTYPLKNMEILYLRSNSLKTLSESLLNWKQLTYADLSGNPWHCNCKIQWLADIHWKHDLQYNIRCASPSNLIGKLIATVRKDEFKCDNHMSVQLIVTLTLITVSAFVGILVSIGLFMYKKRFCITFNSKFQTKYHKVFQQKEVELEYEPKE